jgi:hypothetical protein
VEEIITWNDKEFGGWRYATAELFLPLGGQEELCPRFIGNGA